jgi:hypothetical protein
MARRRLPEEENPGGITGIFEPRRPLHQVSDFNLPGDTRASFERIVVAAFGLEPAHEL